MNSGIRHLPNILTVTRIVLVFPFVWFMFNEQYDRALWTLLLAGVSDGVDGFLARQYNWRSQFGSIADPVADKILLITTFLTLGLTDHLPWWVVAVVVSRDLYIFCGAIAYWFVVGRYEGSPTMLSKTCTFMMIVLGLVVIANLVWPLVPPPLLLWLSYLVVGLSFISMGQYTLLGIRGFARKRAHSGDGHN